MLCISLLFLTVQSLFIIRLCTNKIALKFTLLKQHIKMIVFKTFKTIRSF